MNTADHVPAPWITYGSVTRAGRRRPPLHELFEFQHYDFWIRSQPQWRSPCACTAGGENLHFPNATEAINKLAIDTARHPAPRDELTEMRVPGKLQGKSLCLSDIGMVGCMGQQNAGSVAVERQGAKNRREVTIRSCITVGDAHDLQAVNVHLFIFQDSHSRGGDRVQILAVIPELLVISGDEIHAVWGS